MTRHHGAAAVPRDDEGESIGKLSALQRKKEKGQNPYFPGIHPLLLIPFDSRQTLNLRQWKHLMRDNGVKSVGTSIDAVETSRLDIVPSTMQALRQQHWHFGLAEG